MDNIRLALLAEANLHNLGFNPYPGRIIVCGLDETGEFLVQFYAVMGRSENSRNRVLVRGEYGDDITVSTVAADPSKVKDPSLIIYDAMEFVYLNDDTPLHVVSNGSQTNDVANEPDPTLSLGDKLCDWLYEPDEPNFTPRITATSCWESPVAGGDPWLLSVEMSVLRKSPWSDECDHLLYRINDIGRGYGYCIHTYMGDGNPLPAFQGEPYLLPLRGNAEQIANAYWQTLNHENRVALVVKFIPKDASIPPKIVIINEYEKVG